MSAGRLAKGPCPLRQLFLRRSVSCLTYVKKNGLVDTGLYSCEERHSSLAGPIPVYQNARKTHRDAQSSTQGDHHQIQHPLPFPTQGIKLRPGNAIWEECYPP